MTLTNEDLQAIAELFDQKLEEKLEAKLEEKLEAKLEEKLETKLEEKLEAKLEPIKQGLAEIKEIVNKSYDKTLEFCAMQQEHNTRVSDTLDVVSGKLEIYAEQTARNTIALRRYK